MQWLPAWRDTWLGPACFELADAVRRVARGLRVFDHELAAEAWNEPDPLTDRERQALTLAGEGKPAHRSALCSRLSGGTVRNYLSDSIAKLGAANRVEAARLARGSKNGCVSRRLTTVIGPSDTTLHCTHDAL